MNVEEFRNSGKEMVDYICGYLETIGQRRVFPTVTPGYLSPQMPKEAPQESENWDNVKEDVEKLIMPGITHWQHPNFHAFYPSGNSFPSMLGDMLCDAIGCIGFSWAASPACTELEMIMLDWLAKMMKLPEKFMHSSKLGGGGVLQGSASDSMLLTMIAARHDRIHSEINNTSPVTINKSLQENNQWKNSTKKEIEILDKLICYTSVLTHSAVEKNAKLSFVKIRFIDVDEQFSMRGATLESSFKEDIKNGLIPFYVSATLGTTSCCSFDNLKEIGIVCRKYNVWLHVDAAYAGSSFICPEFQHYLEGIENADSLDFNPNKFMLINFDCSVLWLKESSKVSKAMVVDPVFLRHKYENVTKDFRNWSIPLSRRFRSLKIWFTIRSYGVKGLQAYIRRHVYLAKVFEKKILETKYFEIIGEVILGLVCFRLKSCNTNYPTLTLNKQNDTLLKAINESGLLHLTPAYINDTYFLRFCICKEDANEDEVLYAFKVINTFGLYILSTYESIENSLQMPQAFGKRRSLEEEQNEKENTSKKLIYSDGSKNTLESPNRMLGCTTSTFDLYNYMYSDISRNYHDNNYTKSSRFHRT